MSTTINKEEIQKFSKLAEEWWDVNGKFKPLHMFNPIRIEYIAENIYEITNTKIKNNDPSIPHYKTKPVSIDAIALKWDFCSGSNIPPQWIQWWGINPTWLGELASQNDGKCKHVQ